MVKQINWIRIAAFVLFYRVRKGDSWLYIDCMDSSKMSGLRQIYEKFNQVKAKTEEIDYIL